MNKEVLMGKIIESLPNYIHDGTRDAIVIAMHTLINELDKPKVLKIKRTEDAKQFPLVSAKKQGDVGFDLPAVFPYDYFGKTTIERQRQRLIDNGCTDPVNQEIYLRGSHIVNPGQRVVIPTGISIELPENMWASIEARSSTSKKMLICPKGVIDEGYRGELFAVLLNVGHEPVIIQHGDRYVQLILHRRENTDVTIEEVDELCKSERGASGFGSTGQNEVIKIK